MKNNAKKKEEGKWWSDPLLMGSELCRENEDFWVAPGCAVNKLEFCGFPIIVAIQSIRVYLRQVNDGFNGVNEEKESTFLMKNEGGNQPWNNVTK